VLLLAMAERLSAGTAARLANVMDNGQVRLERDGLTRQSPTRFGVVALDEGIGDDAKTCGTLSGQTIALKLHLSVVHHISQTRSRARRQPFCHRQQQHAAIDFD
ncbi:MAG: hypothetical protein RL717_828, partial [Pseudomonadota bacterium]